MNASATADKHGLAAGNAQPPSADWTIDQGWSNYSAAEHATWKTLFERQSRLLPGRACDEFLSGMKDLPLRHDEIPHFEQLSDVLEKRTGWRVVAVPGLAFLVSAEAAAWVLAGALVVVALLRLVTPAGGLFVARTRLTDVVLLLLLAAALSALAPWAATVDVGG